MSGSTYLNNKHFRRNTKHHKIPINFIFSKGGLGDYINWLTAIEWVANECPHVEGRLLVSQPFLDVARHVLRGKRTFTVADRADYEKVVKNGDGILNPSTWSPYINATGSHLLDLGFIYYCTLSTPPEGYNRLPSIDYEDSQTSKLIKGIGGRYAVITTGATAPARMVRAHALNELINYCRSKDITPVFIGKKDFHIPGPGTRTDPRYYTKYAEGVQFDLGLDLREHTTLLQAVQIMRSAAFVLGVDNGLLHFAGTTETPIIFGHTITTVAHRQIRRNKGTTINITVPRESLSCIGCQSQMRYIMDKDKKGHTFTECIYSDNVCIDMLFANNCATWKKAIDRVLECQT